MLTRALLFLEERLWAFQTLVHTGKVSAGRRAVERVLLGRGRAPRGLGSSPGWPPTCQLAVWPPLHWTYTPHLSLLEVKLDDGWSFC